MSHRATILPQSTLDPSAISDEGERVTHLYPNTCYQAHLSIYQFAVAFCQQKMVLDAGCGAGYGTNYLAAQGAKQVWGIDASAKAIAFSQQCFQHPNLHYQVMDLQQMVGFPAHSLDLIFTSNTLEHIANPHRFFQQAHTMLKEDGMMIVAVPPITNEASKQANLANPYHLNIWSPTQWHYTLSQFFAQVDCYRHHVETAGRPLNFTDSPEEVYLQVEDFLFLPVSLEVLQTLGAITAIFVVRRPFPDHQLPTSLSFIDASYTRPSPLQASGHFTNPAKTNPAKTNPERTNRERIRKALYLIKAQAWRQLWQESYNFIRWKMA